MHFQDVKDSADKKSYEFWSTQPVPKLDEDITTNEAIEPDVPLENMRHEPYSLPAGFQWDTLNLDDPIVVNILVFQAICNNYIILKSREANLSFTVLLINIMRVIKLSCHSGFE